MKYLLVLVVVLGFAWLMFGRGRGRGGNGPAKPEPGPQGKAGKAGKAGKTAAAADDKPVPMLACAHCGVHLPRSDAVADAQGRPFCTDSHRLAGPR